jgi:hypothetical protein
MLQKGIIEPTNEPAAYCKVFWVPEKTKKRRRLLQEPQINTLKEITPGPIKLTTTEDIANGAGHAAATLTDMPWFYGQLLLPQELRKYFCMVYRGKVYQMTTIPTGCRGAPAFADAIMKVIASKAMREAERTNDGDQPKSTNTYIDNVRFTGPPKLTTDALEHFNSIATEMGFSIDSSSEQREVTTYDFLGYHVRHGTKPTISLTQKTKDKIQQCLDDIQRQDFQPTLRELCEMVGICNWGTLNVARFEFYWLFKFLRRRIFAANNGDSALDEPADMWSSARAALAEWCRQLLRKDNRWLLSEDFEWTILITDASLRGFGVFVIPPRGAIQTWGGPFRDVERIEILEARAVQYGVGSLHAVKQGTMGLVIFVDNTTVVGNLKKRRAENFTRNHILGTTWAMIAEKNYHPVRISYIPTKCNLADAMSRAF